MYSFFQDWDNVDEGLPGTCNSVAYLQNLVTNKLAMSTATTTTMPPTTFSTTTTIATTSSQGSTTTHMFRTGQLQTRTTIPSPISDIQTITPRTDLLMQIQTLQHGQTMYIGFLVGFGLFIVLAVILIVYRIKNPGNVTHPPHILCISHTFFLLSNWLSQNNPSPSRCTQSVINFLTNTIARLLTPPPNSPLPTANEARGEDFSLPVGNGEVGERVEDLISLSIPAVEGSEVLSMVVIDNDNNSLPSRLFSSPSSYNDYSACPLPLSCSSRNCE